MAIDSHTSDQLLSVFRTPEARDIVVSAINQGVNPVAGTVAAIPASTNLPTSATAGGSTPTAAQVDTSVNALAAVAETRLDATEAKINQVIAALQAAGLMV